MSNTPFRVLMTRRAAPPPLMRAPTPMSACHFSRVDASPLETRGQLTLLRWVNQSQGDAMIQYVQGSGARIVSVEVDGRAIWTNPTGDARARFDGKMPVVLPKAEVRILVLRTSPSSAPGAELGVFAAGPVNTSGGVGASTIVHDIDADKYPYAGPIYAMMGAAVGVTVGYWGGGPRNAGSNAAAGAVVGGLLGFLTAHYVVSKS